MEILLLAAILLPFVRALRSEQPGQRAKLALCTGALLTLSFWVWLGSALHLVFLSLFTGAWHVASPDDEARGRSAATLALAASAAAVLLGLSIRILGPPGALASFRVTGVSGLSVVLCASAALGASEPERRAGLFLSAVTAVMFLVLALVRRRMEMYAALPLALLAPPEGIRNAVHRLAPGRRPWVTAAAYVLMLAPCVPGHLELLDVVDPEREVAVRIGSRLRAASIGSGEPGAILGPWDRGHHLRNFSGLPVGSRRGGPERRGGSGSLAVGGNGATAAGASPFRRIASLVPRASRSSPRRGTPSHRVGAEAAQRGEARSSPLASRPRRNP